MIRRTILLTILCFATIACTKRQTLSSDPASQLCVVRHAQAFKNLDPRPEHLLEEELDTLTPAGVAQARALRNELPANVTLVWSSPKGRARQTAELLAANEGVVIEKALRPLDGDIEWDEREAGWARGEDVRPEGGESLKDGQARIQAFLRNVENQVPIGRHAIVVTHGDIASLILGELRGTPLLQRPFRDTLATGAMICLQLRTSDR